jgi:hypothetical protein
MVDRDFTDDAAEGSTTMRLDFQLAGFLLSVFSGSTARLSAPKTFAFPLLSFRRLPQKRKVMFDPWQASPQMDKATARPLCQSYRPTLLPHLPGKSYRMKDQIETP